MIIPYEKLLWTSVSARRSTTEVSRSSWVWEEAMQ